MFEIFYHIKSLKYEDKPDYSFIKRNLDSLLILELINQSISQEKFLKNNFSAINNIKAYDFSNIEALKDISKFLVSPKIANDNLNEFRPLFIDNLSNQISQFTYYLFTILPKYHNTNKEKSFLRKRRRNPDFKELLMNYPDLIKRNDGSHLNILLEDKLTNIHMDMQKYFEDNCHKYSIDTVDMNGFKFFNTGKIEY